LHTRIPGLDIETIYVKQNARSDILRPYTTSALATLLVIFSFTLALYAIRPAEPVLEIGHTWWWAHSLPELRFRSEVKRTAEDQWRYNYSVENTGSENVIQVMIRELGLFHKALPPGDTFPSEQVAPKPPKDAQVTIQLGSDQTYSINSFLFRRRSDRLRRKQLGRANSSVKARVLKASDPSNSIPGQAAERGV
jgi:hypothetical protein